MSSSLASTLFDPTEALEVIFGARRWCVLEGDCADVVDRLPSHSVDAIVTDPPAGIGFMGKAWDEDRGGRDAWIAWLAWRLRLAHHVLKHGGYAIIWALPRTSHWTATAIEDAGFEIRDRITHIFGSGYAKSLDMVNGSIDAGEPYPNVSAEPYELAEWMRANRAGFGTALKPACEDWWLARKKPIGTILQNVRDRGTGALNIDATRVRHASPADFEKHAAGVTAIKERGGLNQGWSRNSDLAGASDVSPLGRFPAHLVISHAPGCKPIGPKKVKASAPWHDTSTKQPSTFTGDETSTVHYGDDDGTETITEWQCGDGCPAPLLDAQSGSLRNGGQNATSDRSSTGYGGFEDNRPPSRWTGDEGGASRYFTQLPYDHAIEPYDWFFYEAKASTSEREEGCRHLPRRKINSRENSDRGLNSPRAGAGRKGLRHNYHPTVKSVFFMRFVCRLVSPPDGVVLDLTAGSGTTGVACSAERLRFIGIELEPGYCDLARARILADAPLFNREGGR